MKLTLTSALALALAATLVGVGALPSPNANAAELVVEPATGEGSWVAPANARNVTVPLPQGAGASDPNLNGRSPSSLATDLQAGCAVGANQANGDRGAFTRDTVGYLWGKDSSHNYLIIHTSYRSSFQGKQGVDWDSAHCTFGGVGFNVFAIRNGDLWNDGDGGFINWSFIGRFTRDGPHVHFTAP
ncbi:hypothetical protein D9615_007101 [Tricholomella constricta]|uniref:Uncharacterized protein n=1 Tax=Tricholomella constricta TaxID=117010 RepID=A0A8H5H7W9_9AGAR|nr:hypothetical protein D9615_007101 [Tricholomella constricta]